MKTIQRTTQFKKDYKLANKQKKNIPLLKKVIEQLALDIALEPKFKDHSLTGNYKGTRECHLQPDWLLIYETSPDLLTLRRLGSHSELFKL